MKWVTRDHIHLDRVVCPWLIRRFIDPGAEFHFVEWGKEDTAPKDAIPFAIPDAELGPHDEAGTCFDKFLKKYQLDDPALDEMAKIVESGVHHAITRGDERNNVVALEGIGIDALSQGMMLSTANDLDNLDKSMAIYDAVYAYCKSHVLMEQNPSLAQQNMLQRAGLMKKAISEALMAKSRK